MKKQKPGIEWWIAGVFVLLTVSFIAGFWKTDRELIRHEPVDPEYYSALPVRKATLQPVLVKDGVKYRCNDCHQGLEITDVQKSFFSAHRDIDLNHGVNQSCRSCHSAENKDYLVDINKKHVEFKDNPSSCMTCHGPIYRDWEKGVHGKMNVYWDKSKRTDFETLTCVACHDPHQPKFESMKPSPPPYRYNFEDEKQRLELGGTHE